MTEHHDGLADYPDALPPTLFPVLIDMLRGTMPDAKTAAHLAWHCTGCGLGRWDPHPVMKGKAPKPLSREEAASLLEKALPKKGAKASAAKGLIPWARILPLLLQILTELLGK